MKIEVKYDGKYPNLCSGILVLIINGIVWQFKNHALCSGGEVSFSEDWEENVSSGPWSVTEWPKDFPEKYKEEALREINLQIPWGCCGGCI